MPITVGNGCVIDATGAALCVPGNFQDRYSLGDGRDTMRYLAPHAARVDMGAGDDTYFGALREDSIGQNGKVVQHADVISGTGNDLVTYRSSQRGVRVTLDGLFNDGDRGKENIRPDVEHVEGSNGIDTLIGSDDADKVEQFSGLGGNDTLEGLGGTDIFNEGPRSRTAPTSSAGQAGIDRVNYSAADDPRHGRHGQPRRAPAARPARATSSTRTRTTPSAARPATRCSAARARTCSTAAAAASTSCAATAALDRLIGGTDADKLFGGEGDDVLDAADNLADTRMRLRGRQQRRADRRPAGRGTPRAARPSARSASSSSPRRRSPPRPARSPRSG